jgi:hypothetical protein
MAAAHERDDDGGDDDGGAEHHQVVLERHEHRRDCRQSTRTDQRIQPAVQFRAHGGAAAIRSIKSNKAKEMVAVTYSMVGGW